VRELVVYRNKAYVAMQRLLDELVDTISYMNLGPARAGGD
jgi:hypothetical protein